MKKQIVLLSFILLFNGFTQAQVSADAPTAVTMMDRWEALKPVFEAIRQKLESLTPKEKQNLEQNLESFKINLNRFVTPGSMGVAQIKDDTLNAIVDIVRSHIQNMTPDDKKMFVQKVIAKVEFTPIKDKLEALTPSQKQNLQGLINSINALGGGVAGLAHFPDSTFNDVYAYVQKQTQGMTPEEKRMFANFVVFKIIKQKVDDLTPEQKQSLVTNLQRFIKPGLGLSPMETDTQTIYDDISKQIKNMTPEQKQMFVQKFVEMIQEPGMVVKQTLIRAIPQTIDVRGILPEQTTGQIPTHQILP